MIYANMNYKDDSNWTGNSSQKNNESQDEHESVESDSNFRFIEALGSYYPEKSLNKNF